MKRLIYIMLSLLLMAGCAPKDLSNVYKQISMNEAVEMMSEETDYIILDIRTKAEYEEKHIPDAICIPNEDIGTEPPDALIDKEQLIFVYCRSGNRSKKASQKLADMGYTNIMEFGGIKDWQGEVARPKAQILAML